MLSRAQFQHNFAHEMLLNLAAKNYMKAASTLLTIYNLNLDAALFRAGSIEMLQILISRGADLNVTDQNQNSLLHHPRSLSIAKYFIKQGCSLHSRNSPYRSTPLHYATPDLALLYLTSGAKVDVVNDLGYTPLHLQPGLASVLISYGANVNARALNGDTPLHSARSAKYAKILLDHGANVNSRNQLGQTPLHVVVRVDVAEVLLDNGGDINAVDIDGNSLLHNAKSVEMAGLLVSRGADLMLRNRLGYRVMEVTPVPVAYYLFETLVKSRVAGDDEIREIMNESLHQFKL